MTTQYPQLNRFLAQNHPLLFAVPDLHFLLGSSFTSDTSRATLQLVSKAAIGFAVCLNPEATALIVTLRLCFHLLEWWGR